MDLGLSGKVALVAGASVGMGRGIAEALADEGARVVVTGRSEQRLEPVTAAIEARGGTVHAVAADMMTEAGVRAAVASARAAFGTPDIVVSSAFYIHPENATGDLAVPGIGFDMTSNEQFRTSNEDFVMSVVYLARETLPHMREQGWGRLINIGSCSIKEPHREPLHYLANLRCAVAGLMTSFSNEYARYGITANVIAPGPVRTPSFVEHIKKLGGELDTAEKWTSARVPAGRLGEPEDAGALAAFLASERASWITGQTILLDGGYTRTLF